MYLYISDIHAIDNQMVVGRKYSFHEISMSICEIYSIDNLKWLLMGNGTDIMNIAISYTIILQITTE